MKKSLRISMLVVGLILIIYLIGPAPSHPVFSTSMPEIPASPSQLERFIKEMEAKHKIKPNNEARIVWANDSLKMPTEYAIVYLHGFSASQEEGNPVHRQIAKKFGCNLYLSRLAEHGIDTTEQLVNLTADKLWESAKLALAIGKRLGRKIILMGTSTGGTLALQLAAYYPKDVSVLVLYSPNIAINDPAARLLNNPWGLQIARLVKKSNYLTPPDQRAIYKQYWNSPYRLEAAVALEELIESTMNESTFKKIHQPVLTLYYYKDENHQDPVVKVSAIKEMLLQIGTSEDKKFSTPIPEAGDHVLASPIRSQDVSRVKRETEQFFAKIDFARAN